MEALQLLALCHYAQPQRMAAVISYGREIELYSFKNQFEDAVFNVQIWFPPDIL